MRPNKKFFGDSWISRRYSTESESPDGYHSTTVKIFQDGIQIGTYEHNYSFWSEKFLPLTLEGKDFAVYAPRYNEIAVMTLPDCKQVFKMPKEWWSDDDCPLALYADEYMPGLVFVIWVVWGLERYHSVSYFWLSPDGMVKSRPQGPWDTHSWEAGDPANKFFEFVECGNTGDDRCGKLIVKTEVRVGFEDVVIDREKYVGPMPENTQ